MNERINYQLKKCSNEMMNKYELLKARMNKIVRKNKLFYEHIIKLILEYKIKNKKWPADSVYKTLSSRMSWGGKRRQEFFSLIFSLYISLLFLSKFKPKLKNEILNRFNVQYEPEIYGIGRRLLDSSYDFKYSNEHKTRQLRRVL